MFAKRFLVSAMCLTGILAASAKLPILKFVNATDSVVATYDDAARRLYAKQWPIDYNPAVDKFLSDEGLARYRSVTDDVKARVAISRAFLNSLIVEDGDSLYIDMLVSDGRDLGLSNRVFMQMKELMALLSRDIYDRATFRTDMPKSDIEMGFRQMKGIIDDEIVWEKIVLDPDMYAELSFTNPMPAAQGKPAMLADTISGVIDYNPWHYALNEYMPVSRELDWWLCDMTAKSRFFGNVIRNQQGELIQTSTAEALRLSPRVWEFFMEVLDGLNEPTRRINSLADTWPTNKSEAKAKAEAFFLDKNRGGSMRIFKKDGTPRNHTERLKNSVRPSAFDYRTDIFRNKLMRP